MNKAVFLTAAMIVAAIVSGSVLYAQPGGEGRNGQRPTFEQLDADGDGQITQAEMQAHRQARLAAIDTNGDGLLTLEELTASGRSKATERANRMIERFDENGDGALSLSELRQERRGGRMFERADADGNGTISEAEFADAAEKMRKRGKHKREGNQPEQN